MEKLDRHGRAQMPTEDTRGRLAPAAVLAEAFSSLQHRFKVKARCLRTVVKQAAAVEEEVEDVLRFLRREMCRHPSSQRLLAEIVTAQHIPHLLEAQARCTQRSGPMHT